MGRVENPHKIDIKETLKESHNYNYINSDVLTYCLLLRDWICDWGILGNAGIVSHLNRWGNLEIVILKVNFLKH